MLNKNLTKLEHGEPLFLWRIAQGVTQAEAAERLAVGLTTYQRAERGEKCSWQPPANRIRRGGDSARALCALARRRSRINMKKLAKSLGVSHVTWISLERAADPKILAFWEKRGFTFK